MTSGRSQSLRGGLIADNKVAVSNRDDSGVPICESVPSHSPDGTKCYFLPEFTWDHFAIVKGCPTAAIGPSSSPVPIFPPLPVRWERAGVRAPFISPGWRIGARPSHGPSELWVNYSVGQLPIESK